MNTQLTLSFREGISRNHNTCVEFVQECAIRHSMQQKAIAAEMDLSPSHLSRKLSQNPNDSMRLTVDDLELFMRVTGCIDPVLWLVDKYCHNDCEKIKQLEEQIARLKKEGRC